MWHVLRATTRVSLLIIILSGFICENESPIEPPIRNSDQKCTDGDKLAFNTEYTLVNDQWGKGKITDFEQCISTTIDNGQQVHGWKWRWTNTSDNDRHNQVKGYPHILVGKNPWGNSSASNILPQAVKNVQSLEVHYTLNTTLEGAENSYNLVFDLWITKSANPTKTDIVDEVMIWEDRSSEMTPYGVKIGSPTIGSDLYDLYWGIANNDGVTWTVYSFLPQQQVHKQQGIIQIQPFITDLTSKKLIDRQHFISNLSFGNEIIEGIGETRVSDYSVFATIGPTNLVNGPCQEVISMYPLGTVLYGHQASGSEGDFSCYSDVYTTHGVRISPWSSPGRAYYDFGPVAPSTVSVTFEWVDNAWSSDTKALEIFNWSAQTWEIIASWTGNDGEAHTSTYSVSFTSPNIGPSNQVRIALYGASSSVIHLNTISVQ